MSFLSLIFSLLAVTFQSENTVKNIELNQYYQFKITYPNEKISSKNSLDRTIASDDLIVNDLHEDEDNLAGFIFGPRAFEKIIVKFNTPLENTKKSKYGGTYTYFPLFFKNDHCHIYGGTNNNVKKIKKRRYGFTRVSLPSSTFYMIDKLKLSLMNVYVRPAYLWIDVYDVKRTTPLSEIEALCDNVFTFKIID